MVFRRYNRVSNNYTNHWCIAGYSSRRIQIAHYKPQESGGMDDILQIEHSGIYGVRYISNASDAISDYIKALNDAFNNGTITDGSEVDAIIKSVDSNNYYDKIRILYGLSNTVSRVFIYDGSGNSIASVEHGAWWDVSPDANNSDFYSMRFVPFRTQSSNVTVLSALISLPEDTSHIGFFTVTQTQIIPVIYKSLHINAINTNSGVQYLNTLNLHIFLGDSSFIRVSQFPTYKINTVSKNTSIYKMPPSIHGYGTTIVAEHDIHVVNDISNLQCDMKLFYDTHFAINYS